MKKVEQVREGDHVAHGRSRMPCAPAKWESRVSA